MTVETYTVVSEIPVVMVTPETPTASLVREIPTLSLYIPELLGWFDYQFPFALG